ncbi:MAG: hypothetical protein AABM67_09160 [Acidobacteriota bacterium]
MRSRPSTFVFVGLTSCLIFPSFGVIQKHFGNSGLVIYLILAPALLWLTYHFAADRLLGSISERQSLYLAAITLLALVVTFAVLYPKANTHLPGRGSDADDALNLAASELLSGRYPFYVETYLHNPIGIFPGAVFLALPFVLLGNSSPQNLFWLAAFFFAVSGSVSSWRLGLLLLWTVLLFSPVVTQQLVTGTDDVANSIYVLLFMLLLARWVARPDAAAWKKLLAAFLLGIGLSSRGNFVLVLPQLFAELTRRATWSVAAKYVAIACAAFAAVTFPFWLYDPAGFSPFNTQTHKVAVWQTVLPYSGFVIPALGGLIALALAVKSLRQRSVTWLRDCAIVQAVLVLSVVTLSIIQRRTFSLVLMSYGVFFLFFGVYACWSRMFGNGGRDAKVPECSIGLMMDS